MTALPITQYEDYSFIHGRMIWTLNWSGLKLLGSLMALGNITVSSF